MPNLSAAYGEEENFEYLLANDMIPFTAVN
jgi:hypothetical protein